MIARNKKPPLPEDIIDQVPAERRNEFVVYRKFRKTVGLNNRVAIYGDSVWRDRRVYVRSVKDPNLALVVMQKEIYKDVWVWEEFPYESLEPYYDKIKKEKKDD